MAPLKIHELPEDDRPREKLMTKGAGALSTAELIAILLRTGRAGTNVLELAESLVRRYKTLNALSRCTVAELSKISGIGMAKATQLVAAFGLGHRLAHETLVREKIDTPELVYQLLGPEMRTLHTESLRVLLLDTRYHLVGVHQVSLGSLNESIAHPREIFRAAVIASAFAVIVVHNHPSGDPSPSQADHSLTRRLREVADLLQIKLLDHIIIGAPSADRPPYFSFREGGVL